MNERVLIAGIGNELRGDDAFGVEVARRLARLRLGPGMRAVDYGARSMHLAFDLSSGLDLLIVVDAIARGGEPGTIHLLEPERSSEERGELRGHGMDLGAVFALGATLDGLPKRILLVGCEVRIEECGERIGLSAPIARAVDIAVDAVRALIDRESGGARERANDSPGQSQRRERP